MQPRSFEALDLVPFQISPHYLDPDPSSIHMGETQEERITQFLEENDAPVVGSRCCLALLLILIPFFPFTSMYSNFLLPVDS